LAAAAPGDVVTSKASTARVRILRPTPPSSPHSSGTSTSNNHGTDNTSNTGVNLPPLIGAAIALLLAGWGALLLGRRRRGRHG
jgi:LPXTG-motif cell wall-anchored protein